jgi:hypothetical protein
VAPATAGWLTASSLGITENEHLVDTLSAEVPDHGIDDIVFAVPDDEGERLAPPLDGHPGGPGQPSMGHPAK